MKEHQDLSLHVSLSLPVKQNTHFDHVTERVQRALWHEFRKEFDSDEQMMASIKVTSNLAGSPGPLIVDEELFNRLERYVDETSLTRSNAVSFLYAAFEPQQEVVHEYISEAEHQDGEAYWSQFWTYSQVAEDFVMYVDNINDEGEVDYELRR